MCELVIIVSFDIGCFIQIPVKGRLNEDKFN